MPVSEGSSNNTISKNIEELKKTGHQIKQSIAIALEEARKSKRKGD